MQTTMKNIVALSISCLLSACGGSGDGGGSSGGSSSGTTGNFTENTVVLSDAVAGASNALNVVTPLSPNTPLLTGCTYISDIYSVNGTCITPTKVLGFAEQAYLLKQNGSVGGGTRILGASEFDSAPGTIFEGQEFDLSNNSLLVTNNTLREQYPYHEQYDTLSLSTAYYKIQFPVTISTGTKYVTMLLATYGQPFSSSSAVTNAIANCGLSTEQAATSRYQNADLLVGYNFNRGDYLFCVKDNETDSCAAVDFQWLDTANNTLVSTRPANPKTSHWLANTPVNCSSESNGSVNFDFGPFGIYSLIETTAQFKLWSDFSHGNLSNQWPNESTPMGNSSIVTAGIAWVSPYYVYYYQDCGSGTCENIAQEGVSLDVTLNFNTAQMILVENLDTNAIAALTNIGDVLVNVHNKTQWAFDQKSNNNIVGYDANDMAGSTVQPVITLIGTPTTPPIGAITLCADIDTPTSNCP